ncbi:MAG: hypothetical protein ABSA91_06080 [Acidimicrobiales bacterium]
MGNLKQPLNTFWQLFFRAPGAASWSNKVEAAATATNGGLVLASSAGRSVIVGIRPSALLTYSPLLSTSDAGRSWSDGLVTEGLAARPDALAADASGQVLALVNDREGTEVLSSPGDLANWRVVVSQSALGEAQGPGLSCGLGSLSAVGFLAGRPLVGGSCSGPGVVGLFGQRAGAWRLVGPSLPRPLERGRVEVLALGAVEASTTALLAVSSNNQTDLVAAWSTSRGRWSTSPSLPLGPYEQVASFGAADGSGLFVLLREASGADRLFVAEGSTSGWRELPTPPRGTTTVAFGAGAPAVALVAGATVATVWSLGPTSSTWAKSQVIDVPIQYGSSS